MNKININELMVTLGISRRTAYNKLQGKTLFNEKEIAKLLFYYDICFDSLKLMLEESREYYNKEKQENE